MVIIYLVRVLLPGSICQPTIIGRAALSRLPIWHFSAQGLPPNVVANTCRRLLLYIFTLTSNKVGGYFLWHSLYPACAGSHLLGGALLFAVRTFLPIENGAITQPL